MPRADGKATHVEFQHQIVEISKLLGWWHLTVRRTQGRGGMWVTSTNIKGWPDLLLGHPKHGLAAIEVKIAPDKATPAQEACLAMLAASGVRCFVAYSDLTSEGLVSFFRGGPVPIRPNGEQLEFLAPSTAIPRRS